MVLRKTKKGRKYYGCENNPECEFMSWQKPSGKSCPRCGSYMVEKGNKLRCSNEMCIRDSYEPIGKDREGNEIQLFDIIETEDDAHRKVALKDDVKTLYTRVESELSPRERLVLKMRYGLYHEEEYTQREIAGILGISRSYVSRIEKSAIEKLREFFI